MTATTSKLGADMTDFQINLLASHYWEIKEVMGVRTDKFDAVGFARALLDRQPAPSVEQDERGAEYGATDFGYTFAGIHLEEGDKRLMAMLVSALGTEHPAIEDLTALLFRAASTSANVAQGAEALGWAWERRYLNGGYSRKFCVSEFDARELAKDGENLPAHDLVYPFYTAPPAQTALTDDARDAALWRYLAQHAVIVDASVEGMVSFTVAKDADTGAAQDAAARAIDMLAAQSASGDTK